MSGTEERRVVTSLFIDVVGSTELTVRLGPERIKGALDAAFAELRAIIAAEGGTVEKYIGDAIYALFGAPITHPDDPERALRAAAGARAWAASRASSEMPFGVRVGLETGEAIIDLTAAAETKQQMSVGAVVNTAARLQQRAEPGQILVGPVTHEATANMASFTPLGTVELKGLGAIAVWQLDDVRESPGRQDLPFVGREAELELLGLAGRRARTRSVLALVSGPPGQGKTRLVEEFLASWPGVRVLGARCRPGGEVGALAPLRQLLLGDRPEGALDDVVAEAIPPAERARVADALAHSAGIRSSASLAAIGRDERADEIENAWRALIRGLGTKGPLAVWVEDVHWAAAEVVALIDRLSLSGEPVLVIATARPEFAEQAGIRPSGDRFFIELDALEPEAAHLLASSAGRDDAGTIERAGGNPLFIVELARARDPGGDLPLTLQGALGARLDDLDPDDRALLARGAVLGETFSVADCAMLCQREPPVAARALARLAERQYLDPVDGRYRFHHSLLRDVAYGRLLVADRMRLHARYAREARVEDPEVVAYHWWAALGTVEAEWVWKDAPELAAMRRDAFTAHLAAGRRQAALFATDRSVGLLERAYALADDEASRAIAKHALADAHSQDLHGDEAWSAYLDAQRHYRAAGGDAPAELYIGGLKNSMRAGSFQHPPTSEDVAAFAADGQRVARAAGDPALLARVLVYSAFKDFDPGSQPANPELLAEAVRLSERTDPATRREILGWQAEEHLRAMRTDDAIAVFEQIDALPGERSELDEMEYLRGRAVVAFRRGRLDELTDLAARILATSTHAGPHLRTHAEVIAAQLAFSRGDWDAVARYAIDTDERLKTSPTTPFCVAAATMLGYGAVVRARAGQPDEARALVRAIDRIVYERLVTASLKVMGLAFTGERVEIDAPTSANSQLAPATSQLTYLAVAAIATKRHSEALALADQLERNARGGSRFLAALAQAMREEVSRDRGGPAPTHALLGEIGYRGWSEVLSARA